MTTTSAPAITTALTGDAAELLRAVTWRRIEAPRGFEVALVELLRAGLVRTFRDGTQLWLELND